MGMNFLISRQPARALALGLLVFLIMAALGCAGGYNTPFINTDETLNLEFGMTTNEVLASIGEPYYVHSGGDGTLRWDYEVRTESVRSENNGTPRKTDMDKRHDPPVHRLGLVFQDGKLIKWAPLLEVEEVAR